MSNIKREGCTSNEELERNDTKSEDVRQGALSQVPQLLC